MILNIIFYFYLSQRICIPRTLYNSDGFQRNRIFFFFFLFSEHKGIRHTWIFQDIFVAILVSCLSRLVVRILYYIPGNGGCLAITIVFLVLSNVSHCRPDSWVFLCFPFCCCCWCLKMRNEEILRRPLWFGLRELYFFLRRCCHPWYACKSTHCTHNRHTHKTWWIVCT